MCNTRDMWWICDGYVMDMWWICDGYVMRSLDFRWMIHLVMVRGWSTFVSVLPCYDGGCPVTQPGCQGGRSADIRWKNPWAFLLGKSSSIAYTVKGPFVIHFPQIWKLKNQKVRVFSCDSDSIVVDAIVLCFHWLFRWILVLNLGLTPPAWRLMLSGHGLVFWFNIHLPGLIFE